MLQNQLGLIVHGGDGDDLRKHDIRYGQGDM